MVRSTHVHFGGTASALALLLVISSGPIGAQQKAASPSAPKAAGSDRNQDKAPGDDPDRDHGVVKSLNGAEGDLTIKGDGGLIVARDKNTITVTAGPSVGIGRTNPDPKYALDVGGTGIVRIGNSIYLNGINNSLTTSTGAIDFSNNSVSTTGVITANGSGLTHLTPANIDGGTLTALFHFTNAGNTFNGAFTGNGSGLTGVQSSGLAGGVYANLYSFTNANNAFTGVFTGNGAGLTNVNAATAVTATSATTAATASTLAAGAHLGAYTFSNGANAFTGAFAGNGSGLTNVTAAALAGGTFGNIYHFTNTANTFNGTFTGDGSALTGVQTSGLAGARTRTSTRSPTRTTRSPGRSRGTAPG